MYHISTMFYVYVLKSSTHHSRYIGSTQDIKKRLLEHNNGKCRYTKGRSPWKLVYKEELETRGDAMKREKFLKSGKGREFLDNLHFN